MPTSPTAETKARPTRACTDLGNAERLVDLHGQDLRHAQGLAWVTWDERRWERDVTGEVNRRAKDAVRQIYAEAAANPSEDERKRLSKHAIGSERAERIRAMISLAASEREIATRTSAFDRDPWLLNVANGTLDLRTGDLLPHRREDLITKVLPIAYDKRAQAPEWHRFLERVQPDRAIREYLQRLGGYSATGVVRDHVLPIHIGEGGNGKGVFTGTVQYVLGEYARQVPSELLMEQRFDANPTGRAVLFGTRLAVASETEDGRAMNVALVKLLTGGDRISARFMRGNFFDFDPTHKLWLLTNHTPRIKERKNAIWRRVHLVPWDVIITPGSEDLGLGETLRGEAAGILAWLVAGCIEWQRGGLRPPDTIVAATAAYRKGSDAIGPFLRMCCELDASARTTRADLLGCYMEWIASGERGNPLDAGAFSAALREAGIIDASMRSSGGNPERGWRGIRIRRP